MSGTAQVALGELSAAKLGSIDPSRYPHETFELYSISAFDRGFPDHLRGSDIGSAKQSVKPGDVLLSRIVPHIRRAWVVGSDMNERIIASNEWLVFRSERFHSDYLRHVLTGDAFHRAFMATVSGVGGSLLRAKPSYVARIKIPLPPLAEQRRIAELLDRADAVRRKREESLRLVDELLRSVFLEMFGDPVRNELGWEVGKMKDVISRIEAGTSVNGENREPLPGEWAVLKISAVTSGQFLPNECKVIVGQPKNPIVPQKGDLLFSRANTRELVAATCIVDKDVPNVFLPDKLWRLSTAEQVATPEFLHYLLRHPAFRNTLTKNATGTSGSMLNVSQEKLLALRLPLPSIQTQRRFSEIVRHVIAVRARLSVAGSGTGDLGRTIARSVL